METPPRAPERPHTLIAFDHERVDPWYWLRERDNSEVVSYLEAENSYTDAVLAPLEGLRTTLFEEMKARILETDMSVPSRRGPWWYYGRTEEGKDYAIHCRRPARVVDELPPAGEPGEDEQILLDENVLAEGHEYFALGTAAVSPDHTTIAYGTDSNGDERYELRFKSLIPDDPSDRAPEVVADTGYGLAWSSQSDIVFYTRLDEAMRPFQLWRHELGTEPSNDASGVRRGGSTVLPRNRAYPGRRLRPARGAQHEHHRMAGHTGRRPDGRAPGRTPPTRRTRILRRPRPGARWARLVRRPDQRGRAGLPGARRSRRCRGG